MARPDQLALVCVVYAIGVLTGLEAQATTAFVLPGLAALLVVGVAIHYANEYADYDTDAITTRTPYSGGSGALHAANLDRSFARHAFAVALPAAVLALAVAAVVDVPPTALALLGTILTAGVAYSLGPRLAWRGLGELTNAVLGGLCLPLFGVAITGTTPTLTHVLAFTPFTVVVFANLLATQWPDRHADAHVGKRTLAVRLEVATLRRLYTTAAVLGIGGLLALAATDVLPPLLVALATPTAGLLVVGRVRFGHTDSPATTVHAMVVLAFAYLLAFADLLTTAAT
jgi:1,4-dihydroxy-2-naphthoate octaprenyltransferase